uniref:F-box domain-containing protein n=1 Tax=Ditylenchus dipsaci TaxID=166011 RepID=A0A915DCA5_9BILA
MCIANDVLRDVIKLLTVADCQKLFLVSRTFCEICLVHMTHLRNYMLVNGQMDILNENLILSSTKSLGVTDRQLIQDAFKVFEQVDYSNQPSFCFVLLDPGLLPFMPSPPVQWVPRNVRACSLQQLVNAIFYVGVGNWDAEGPVGSMQLAKNWRSNPISKPTPRIKKILELWDSGSAPISVHADKRGYAETAAIASIFQAAIQHTLDAEQYSKDVSKIITQLLPWPMQKVEDLGVQLLSSLLFRLQTMTVVPLIFEDKVIDRETIKKNSKKNRLLEQDTDSDDSYSD